MKTTSPKSVLTSAFDQPIANLKQPQYQATSYDVNNVDWYQVYHSLHPLLRKVKPDNDLEAMLRQELFDTGFAYHGSHLYMAANYYLQSFTANSNNKQRTQAFKQRLTSFISNYALRFGLYVKLKESRNTIPLPHANLCNTYIGCTFLPDQEINYWSKTIEYAAFDYDDALEQWEEATFKFTNQLSKAESFDSKRSLLIRNKNDDTFHQLFYYQTMDFYEASLAYRYDVMTEDDDPTWATMALKVGDYFIGHGATIYTDKFSLTGDATNDTVVTEFAQTHNLRHNFTALRNRYSAQGLKQLPLNLSRKNNGASVYWQQFHDQAGNFTFALPKVNFKVPYNAQTTLLPNLIAIDEFAQLIPGVAGLKPSYHSPYHTAVTLAERLGYNDFSQVPVYLPELEMEGDASDGKMMCLAFPNYLYQHANKALIDFYNQRYLLSATELASVHTLLLADESKLCQELAQLASKDEAIQSVNQALTLLQQSSSNTCKKRSATSKKTTSTSTATNSNNPVASDKLSQLLPTFTQVPEVRLAHAYRMSYYGVAPASLEEQSLALAQTLLSRQERLQAWRSFVQHELRQKLLSNAAENSASLATLTAMLLALVHSNCKLDTPQQETIFTKIWTLVFEDTWTADEVATKMEIIHRALEQLRHFTAYALVYQTPLWLGEIFDSSNVMEFMTANQEFLKAYSFMVPYTEYLKSGKNVDVHLVYNLANHMIDAASNMEVKLRSNPLVRTQEPLNTTNDSYQNLFWAIHAMFNLNLSDYNKQALVHKLDLNNLFIWQQQWLDLAFYLQHLKPAPGANFPETTGTLGLGYITDLLELGFFNYYDRNRDFITGVVASLAAEFPELESQYASLTATDTTSSQSRCNGFYPPATEVTFVKNLPVQDYRQ